MQVKATIACDVCDKGDAQEYVTDPLMPGTSFACCPECLRLNAVPYYTLTATGITDISPVEGKTTLYKGKLFSATAFFAHICKARNQP